MATPVSSWLPTGAGYRESRRDGRQVWVAGERIKDITVHPATAAVVDAYADWYDKHHDPAWQERLLAAPDEAGRQLPVSFAIPRTPDDLKRLGEAVRALCFLSAGNVTHPPDYGAVIMLGVLDTLQSYGSAGSAATARACFERLVSRGLHVVAPFADTSTDRFRAPEETLIPRVVRETDGGVVVRGSLGMGTSLCYADAAFVGVIAEIKLPEQAIWFMVPVNAPGVIIFARQPSVRTEDRFLYPISSRFDELDCAIHLDDVFIPWEDVLVYRDVEFCTRYMGRNPYWTLYYHLARQLAHAEFSLGLALAATQMQGCRDTPWVSERLTDLIIHAQTLRTALRAAAADARPSPAGTAMPDLGHLVAGTVAGLEKRGWLAQTVRTLAGHQVMLAPSLEDLAAEDLAPAMAPNYEGGGVGARQRAALLHLLRDHTASALEGRASAFDALATAGLPRWRARAQASLTNPQELVDGVLALLSEEDRPAIDLAATRLR